MRDTLSIPPSDMPWDNYDGLRSVVVACFMVLVMVVLIVAMSPPKRDRWDASLTTDSLREFLYRTILQQPCPTKACLCN